MGKEPRTAAARKPLPPNLYRRGETIWARVKVGGTEHRRSLRTADVAEARTQLDLWRAELVKADAGQQTGESYKAAVVRWTKEVLPGAVKPSVMRRYLASMAMLDPVFADMRVTEITERVISRYISTRAGQVTNATIRRDITALSKLLSACIAWGWIDRNPAKFYDRSIIKEQKRTITLPSDADVAWLMDRAPAGMVAPLRLLAETGMRENEAVTLEATNINHTSRTITLVKTKSSRPRRLNWQTPGGDATDVLTTFKDQTTGHLFTTRDGTPYQNFATNFGQVMREAVRRAEDEEVPFTRWRAHDLRHRFAVRWLQAGGDIYRLSRHLGHSSVKTTEIYLDHLSEDELDAVRGVTAVVAQGKSGTS